MNKKQKLTIVFFVIIFSLEFYIFGIYSILSLIITLFFYSIITYVFYGIYNKLKNKAFVFFSKNSYKNFLPQFLYKISSLIIVLIIIIGGFTYYQNEISPALMPIYTISNGDKIIVFQTMSHIGTNRFYEKVKNNIQNLKLNGYVLYFEGVRPGTQENEEAFNRALGIKFDDKTYVNMSKLYGLVNQDNSMFLGLVNNKDYNVDISIDDIMEEYKTLKIAKGITNRTYSEPIDASKIIMDKLSQLGENELKVLRYINRSFINLIVKSDNLQKIIQNNFANKELFEIILNKRNEFIAKKIISSEDKKIVATYGMLHFTGVFQLLKQNDIKWQIQKIDYLYPIK